MLNELIYKVRIDYQGVEWADVHGMFHMICMESTVETAGLSLTEDELSGELTADNEADLDYVKDNLMEYIKCHASSWSK